MCGAAQEPMEDDAEKQKRASGWEDLAERTKRPKKDDDQDEFDEARWAEEYVDGQSGAGVLSDLGGGGICSGDCLEVHILPPREDDQNRRTRG